MYGVVLMAALTTGGGQAPLFHHFGGYGQGYGGCYGYCYGGWGHPWHPPAGCWGAGYACYGCCGGYHDLAYAPVAVGTGPYLHGGPADGGGTIPRPTPDDDRKTPDDGKKKKKNIKDDDDLGSARARLVIDVPEGVTLFVDDREVKANGRKTFQTPLLERDEAYFYEVRAEMMVDGERVTETRRVTVRAGEVSREDFRALATTGRRAGPATARSE
jgi:uncharacterized protein (TIGR03000 family)